MAHQEALATITGAIGSDCYHLSAAEREKLEALGGWSTEDLLRLLVDYIKPHAVCPISKFEVGAVGLTGDGEVFMGVNVEYTQTFFAQTIHAEQFLISWARSNSASPLTTLAVSAPPCGHCRQFMHEFDPDGRIRLLIGNDPGVAGASLLPRAFTPRDLDVTEPFFIAPPDLQGVRSLPEAARLAAQVAYAPYSRAKAGAAVATQDGEIVVGCSLENAAYNPTLPPLQGALIVCLARGIAPTSLQAVAVCQHPGGIDFTEQGRRLAQALGIPAERFQVVEP